MRSQTKRRSTKPGTGKTRIVVVGQTPPPFGGQAVMIEALLSGHYTQLDLVHVRLAFSKEMQEVGRPTLRKVGHLIGTVSRIIVARYRSGARTLVYPPAGPDRVPLYRDLVILICVRPFFRYLILHFHASGVSELYPSLSAPVRALFRSAYYGADAGIRTSALNPDDPGAMMARHSYVVPCGIPDLYDCAGKSRRGRATVSLLYVGALMESKGVLVLIEACAILRGRSCPVDLNLVGEASSVAFADQLRSQVADMGLAAHVRLSGVLTGQSKLDAYLAADVFCYPTFFKSESFGVVLLEAMQHGLPIVATRWRGIPSVVDDQRTAYLVEPRDAVELADAIERLIENPNLAIEMGQLGRQRFLDQFTLATYQLAMETIISAVADGEAASPLLPNDTGRP